MRCNVSSHVWHARLHANVVVEKLPQLLVYADDKIDGALLGRVNRFEPVEQQGATFASFEVGGEVAFKLVAVGERVGFGSLFYKKVKRIDHRHVRDDIYLY